MACGNCTVSEKKITRDLYKVLKIVAVFLELRKCRSLSLLSLLVTRTVGLMGLGASSTVGLLNLVVSPPVGLANPVASLTVGLRNQAAIPTVGFLRRVVSSTISPTTGKNQSEPAGFTVSSTSTYIAATASRTTHARA